MSRRAHRFSIFSQSLDRAAFLAYLLGAVVPFVALAFVVHRFVLPALPEGHSSSALIALTVSVGVLSAASFLVLRRVTWQTVDRIDQDRARLAALLETSGQLASAAHGSEVAQAAAQCALTLCDAPAAFVVLRSNDGALPKLEAFAGDGELFRVVEPDLDDLLEQIAGEQSATIWTPSQGGEPGPWVAAPMGEDGALLAPPVAVGDGPAASALSSVSMLAGLASVAVRNARLADAQRNFFVHVTDILVAALDTHMKVQSGHSRRVAHLCNQIGRELGLDDETRQRLHFASLLHDVGMLRIDHRLGKQGYRQHPVLGHRMLAPIQLWSELAPIVLHHHEWWDGSGYPEGLVGADIPHEARIIGLAEAFDSMTSTSSYKEPVGFDEALRRVEQGAGTQFDPDVARLFLELAARGEIERD